MPILTTFASVFSLNIMCAIVYCGPRMALPSDPLIENGNTIIKQGGALRNTKAIYGRALNTEELQENPIVITNYGGVEGYIMETISKRKIYAFEGIPYAENTGGENRFKLSVPKAPWSPKIFKAKGVGPYCPQITFSLGGFIKGHEDCLSLNVYSSPNAEINKQRSRAKANLPVIVFIHGGAFSMGASRDFGVSYILDSNVHQIFVTINYRLGILGFLSTGDEVSPGNNGLKDQQLALKWVYENIGYFGGNNSRITLMGQSAAAISMSGTAFNTWAVRTPSFTQLMNERIARNTNCPVHPSNAFVECLRTRMALDITRVQHQLPDWLFTFPSCPLSPVVEPESEHAFITKRPEEYYKSNDVAKVPWMVTRTKDETDVGRIMVQLLMLKGHVNRHIYTKMPLMLEYDRMNLSKTEMDDVTTKILNYYSKGSKFSNITELFTEISTDRIFGYPINKATKAHSKIAPTYSYIFNVNGEHAVPTIFNLDPKDYGVSHSDDLIFLLNTTFIDGWKTTDYSYPLVWFMTDLVSNFAAVSEPLHKDASGKYWKIWEPVTDPENVKILSIEESAIKMIPEPNTEHFKFWESLNLPDMRPLDHDDLNY